MCAASPRRRGSFTRVAADYSCSVSYTHLEAYAVQIARDWNVKESGAGFVTRFQIDADFLGRYKVQQVGAAIHKEYWIPAEDLDEFNQHLLGKIEVTAEFR